MLTAGAPRRIAALLVGITAMISGCGSGSAANEGAAASGTLSVSVLSYSTAQPTEGALVLVDVLDDQDRVVARNHVTYPVLSDDGSRSRRFDLLDSREVPAGDLTLSLALLICSGSPCDPALAASPPPNLTSDICDVAIAVEPDQDTKLLLVIEDGATCRVTQKS